MSTKKRIYWIVGTIFLLGIFIILNFYLKKQNHGIYEWLPSALYLPLLYGINVAFFNFKLLPQTKSLVAVCVGVIIAILDAERQESIWILKISVVLISTFIIWICFYRKKGR